MPMKILVLHGPNLNLLGERPGDAPGRTLEELNRLIRKRALTLAQDVRIIQSNHEGVLVDTLQAERKWADGILVSPGALARSAYVLRDAIRAVGKPALEIHLDEYRNAEGKRLKSVLKDVCAGRVFGKGFDSYLVGLERFAVGELAGQKGAAREEGDDVVRAVVRGSHGEAPRKADRTIGPGPKPSAPAERPAASPGVRVMEKSIGPGPREEPKPRKSIGPAPRGEERSQKSIGPARGGAEKARPATEKTLGRRDKEADSGVLTREKVRQKIADRLSGKVTAADLVLWARAQWLEIQRGAPTERGQRELLEDALQQLVVSTAPQSRVTDEQLVDLMTRLEG